MKRDALLACLLAAAATAHAGSSVEIELRKSVVATPGQLRLGDVAFVRTPDLPTMRQLLALPISRAPRAGEEVSLERTAVQQRVQETLAGTAHDVSWQGEERTLVRGIGTPSAVRQLESATRATLQEWLAKLGIRAGIEAVLHEDLRLPPGRVEFLPRPIRVGVPSSRMVVWADAWVDGTFVRAVPVSFAVDVFGSASDAPAAPAARRAAPRLTKEAAVSPPAIVARGQWVALRLANGSLQLEARAEALEEGRAGDVVRVRLAGASGVMEARVLARGRVEAMP